MFTNTNRPFPLRIHRSTLVLLTAVCLAWPFSARAGTVAKDSEKSRQVDQVFLQFRKGVQPGAAVMVIRDGEIVHSAGYGYANLEEETPITTDSTFRLGSVSKQFTAMAIAILAEGGKLDYDDPVSKYVPALASYEGVTIRHVLTHTSGLPDYYDVIDLSPWSGATAVSGAIPSNSDVMAYEGEMNAPLFEPGERYEYSNPAFEALPLIVEAVSGQSFANFMKHQVFGPIGMDDSLIHDHTRPGINRQVLGYSKVDDGYELNDWDTLNGITGSGSQFSTLRDFFQWDQALYGEELVSGETLEQVFTRAKLNNGKEIDYGFGWRLDSYRGHDRIAHGGSWVGFNTAISRYPDLKLTVVILSNREDYDPVAVSDQVTDIYLD